MLLHVNIDALELLIVEIYILPSATVSLLKCFIPILSTYATGNIIIAGDFNMLPNTFLDKLNSGTTVDSALSKWASLYGDMFEGGSTLISMLLPATQLLITPCHGLTCFMLVVGCWRRLGKLNSFQEVSQIKPSCFAMTPPSERLWRLSCYWISNPTIVHKIITHISEFWVLNNRYASFDNVWDAFKAYVRGCDQSSISRAR